MERHSAALFLIERHRVKQYNAFLAYIYPKLKRQYEFYCKKNENMHWLDTFGKADILRHAMQTFAFINEIKKQFDANKEYMDEISQNPDEEIIAMAYERAYAVKTR